MAVVSINKMRASDTFTSARSTTGFVTYTDKYKYLMILDTDETIAGAYVLAVDHASIPALGVLHPSIAADQLVLLSDISLSHYEDQKKMFEVEITYSNEEAENTAGGGDDNTFVDPTTLPAQYASSPVDNMRVVRVHKAGDDSGKIIAYTNGKAVNPAFMENFPLNSLTVTKNMSSVPSHGSSQQKVNSGSFTLNGTTYAKNQVQFSAFSWNSAVDDEGTTYYVVTYNFLINTNGFEREYINADTVQLKADGSFGKMPQTSNRPWKLDANGAFVSNVDNANSSEFTLLKAYTLEGDSFSGISL